MFTTTTTTSNSLLCRFDAGNVKTPEQLHFTAIAYSQPGSLLQHSASLEAYGIFITFLSPTLKLLSNFRCCVCFKMQRTVLNFVREISVRQGGICLPGGPDMFWSVNFEVWHLNGLFCADVLRPLDVVPSLTLPTNTSLLFRVMM